MSRKKVKKFIQSDNFNTQSIQFENEKKREEKQRRNSFEMIGFDDNVF